MKKCEFKELERKKLTDFLHGRLETYLDKKGEIDTHIVISAVLCFSAELFSQTLFRSPLGPEETSKRIQEQFASCMDHVVSFVKKEQEKNTIH